MNSSLFANIARFILLIITQVVVFNNITFLGYISSFPYILFILLYPVNNNRYAFLIISFLLGLIIDFFCNSGGVHSTACLILAYLRPYIFKFSFGLSYEYQTIKINDVLSSERFSFIAVSVLIHHLILFSLETFQFDFFLGTIFRIIFSSILTIIISISIIYLIKPSKS